MAAKKAQNCHLGHFESRAPSRSSDKNFSSLEIEFIRDEKPGINRNYYFMACSDYFLRYCNFTYMLLKFYKLLSALYLATENNSSLIQLFSNSASLFYANLPIRR